MPANVIQPISEIKSLLGDSRQAKYIRKYLRQNKVSAIIIENDYIDKDWLMDLSYYHIRSFKVNEKKTTRVHFFKQPCNSSLDFTQLVLNKSSEELQRMYLGFVVVKPVRDLADDKLIGRTIILPAESSENPCESTHIKTHQRASLFGHELSLESLPFQSQDTAVGMCATASLWMMLHGLNELFETPTMSLYEITDIASKTITSFRSFPSPGLNLYEISYFLRTLGLELELLNMVSIEEEYPDRIKQSEVISHAIRAYLNAGIPILAGIEISEGSLSDYHAVVISGCEMDKNSRKIRRLFIHDDQVGPYVPITSTDGFLTWTYEKDDYGNADRVKNKLNKLIIPMYHKIRQPYLDLYSYLDERLPNLDTLELLLYQVKDYKKELLTKRFRNKRMIIQKAMPRFLWVLRQFTTSGYMKDLIIDATSNRYDEECIVEYL